MALEGYIVAKRSNSGDINRSNGNTTSQLQLTLANSCTLIQILYSIETNLDRSIGYAKKTSVALGQ